MKFKHKVLIIIGAAGLWLGVYIVVLTLFYAMIASQMWG